MFVDQLKVFNLKLNARLIEEEVHNRREGDLEFHVALPQLIFAMGHVKGNSLERPFALF